jgi:hypothetical protein
MKNISHGRWRQLLAATLAIGGAFQIIAPALAGGTGAGTVITNTATGKFTDGSGTNYDTTSNTVTIAVSEIAGIRVDPQTPSVTTPNAGDILYVDFVVTNTGNDPTQFFIPGSATLSNTTAFAPNGPLQIVAVNGALLGTPVTVPPPAGALPGGDTTGNLLGTTGVNSGSLVPNPGTGTAGTVTIRVPIKALGTATAGQILKVSLGNTSPVDGQNQIRTGAAVNPNDLYTVDNGNGVGGETNATAPTNGVVEAMATSTAITVNARLQAFAAVLKAVSVYNPGTTPNDLTDDTLSYKLALRVENPATPPTGLVTSDLYGTQLTGNGDGTIANTKSYVLVSDAIPTGLQFGPGSTLTSTDARWVPVYTTDALTTNALSAKWTTTKPTAGTIYRIGFVYDTGANGPISKGAAGVGNTVSGLTVTLNTATGFAGGQIANIAQTFGQSQPSPGVAPAPGTATQIVYDESGDQTANNGLSGTNPDSTTAGGVPPGNGGITDGVANPTADGTDPGTGNDPTVTTTTNTGTDTVSPTATKALGGEDTIYTIASTPLNGPLGQPGAVGPTTNNDDFTNKSLQIAAGTNPATKLDPAPFAFTNTVQNTSGGTQVISLLPTKSTVTTDPLPDNAKVSIKDSAGNIANYDYTIAGGFVFNPTGSTPGLSATNPIKITVAPGLTIAASPSYTLTLDLPANTPQLTGFAVPVTAFVDTNSSGLPAGNPSNITIDRLYTNYLSLTKKARILLPDGVTPVTGAAGLFTDVQADLSAAATPGNIIEYQITYKNISTAGGTNSVILPANNLVITESGIPVAGVSANNWFGVTTDPKYPTQPLGTGADSAGGTITVTVNGTDIQVYTDTIAKVDPGTAGGILTFQRMINK